MSVTISSGDPWSLVAAPPDSEPEAIMAQSHPIHSVLLAFLILVVWVSPSAMQAQLAPTSLEAAIESITDETILSHLSVLASDQLRGRNTPSAGLETAASYLANRHLSYGLEPAGASGTFFQRYPFGLMGPDPDNAQVTFVGPGGSVEVRVGRDAFIEGGSDTFLDGPLTFTRFTSGTQPQPGSMGGEIAVFSLPGSWGQSLWQSSLEQADFARTSGAVAVVHILDSEFPASVIRQLGSSLAQPRWRLGGDAFLPQLFVRSRAIEGVIPGGAPWARATLRAQLPLNVVNDATPPNVLAELPGSDPELRDEYIVLSAHFDHVGVGRPIDGDSIYNGADDNGSGTSALLEVARVLASLPTAQRPRRTVVFAHVSAEEKGLLGSEWWVDHPTRPIENVIANINTDMISGDTHPDTVAVLGMEYSSLGPLILAINRARPELRLATVPDMWPEEGLFFRSDQLNFMREDIPSVFLFAGLHDCYHQPCDDLDFVNPDKASRVARLLAYTVLEIANSDSRPEWEADGLREVRRLISGGR